MVETRTARNGRSIRRRRECLACGRRFTTWESIEMDTLMVVKKDGRREHYSREKLMRGVRLACTKLPIPREEMEGVVDRVEVALQDSLTGEVATLEIGQIVMDRLADLDKVAYIRFASVYRRYRNMHEFLDEVRELLKE